MLPPPIIPVIAFAALLAVVRKRTVAPLATLNRRRE